MSWQVVLLSLIVVGSAGGVLTKLVANQLPKRSSGVFYQYLACAILAGLFSVVSHDLVFNYTFLLVGAIGIVNAFGNYFMWQAMGTSLSKTALFLPVIGIVPVLLSVIFLNEAGLWNVQLSLGIVACFVAIWLLGSKPRDDHTGKVWDKKWIFWIILMVLAQGSASFAVKWFSSEISLSGFLLAWYLFSFIGSILILGVEGTLPIKVPKLTILVIFGVSVSILGALALLKSVYELGGPVSIVQPIYGLSGMILSILAGLWIFREKHGLTKSDKIGFVIGLLGAILVLLR